VDRRRGFVEELPAHRQAGGWRDHGLHHRGHLQRRATARPRPPPRRRSSSYPRSTLASGRSAVMRAASGPARSVGRRLRSASPRDV